MRLLFTIDLHNYITDGTTFVRPSSRAIYIKDKKIAMVHSLKYDYYKFPGGGIDMDESPVKALIRETKEETGLIVIPQEIKEYGYVHRVQKGKREDMFIQDNYYYFVKCEEQIEAQELEIYEKESQFTLEFVTPNLAININRNSYHGKVDLVMIERETMILEMLMSEGYFN